jgi:hypothetical protein
MVMTPVSGDVVAGQPDGLAVRTRTPRQAKIVSQWRPAAVGAARAACRIRLISRWLNR